MATGFTGPLVTLGPPPLAAAYYPLAANGETHVHELFLHFCLNVIM